ncbi:MAG: GTPase [Candidatus Omnitrophota bacterium]|nr:GTPase [Candidatus Omnitrophota bacterium]
MIIDEVKIYLKAGNGGEGSFSSMKLSPRRLVGGGGDGGKGANVIFKVSPHLSDLVKFNDNKKFIAQGGERGREYNKKGKNGVDLIVNVPAGTMVLDLEGSVIVDLIEENQEYLICQGGAGGKGNYKKLYSIPAEKGQEKEVILYYCVPNDVAIVGFANCGKTSLFNKFTGKSYKVAPYPFTTKACVWAPVSVDFKKFTVLDTPPLKKSLENSDIKHRFLRHLSRSKIILLLSEDLENYAQEFALLKKEISSFDPQLLEGKKLFYLLCKVDKIDKRELKIKGVIPISVEKDKGIEELKKKIIKTLISANKKDANDR